MDDIKKLENVEQKLRLNSDSDVVLYVNIGKSGGNGQVRRGNEILKRLN